MPATVSRISLLPAVLLSLLFCCVYFIAGTNQPLNWDEEASVDIALGIRPQFMIDSIGLPNNTLPYEQIIQKPVFSSADYEKQNSTKGVIHSVWRDNSNSLAYYLTLHYFIKLVGVNFQLMRILSVVLAGICLLLAFVIARKWNKGGWYVPFLVLVLLGSNPVFFPVAFAIRGYMLCLALLLCSTLVWMNMLEARKYPIRRVLLFATLSVAAVLTHYFSVAIVSFQFLFLLVQAYRITNTITNRGVLNVVIGVLVFLAPLMFWYFISLDVGIRNMFVLDAGWKRESSGKGWAAAGFNYVKQLFNAVAYFVGFDFNAGLLPRVVWQSIALLVLALLGFVLIKTRVFKQRIFLMFYIAAWAVLIYFIKSVFADHFMIFEKKYLLFIVPYFIIGVVVAMDALLRQRPSQKPFAKAILVTMLFINVISFATGANNLDQKGKTTLMKNSGELPRNNITIKNDTRVLRWVGRQLSVQLKPQDSLVYNRWHTAHRLNYFLRDRADVYQRVDSLQAAGNLIKVISRGKEYIITIKDRLVDQ